MSILQILKDDAAATQGHGEWAERVWFGWNIMDYLLWKSNNTKPLLWKPNKTKHKTQVKFEVDIPLNHG